MTHLVEHPAMHEPTPELIAHIRERYHDTHRREIAELLELARKVERRHADDPDAPVGLADHLDALADALETHMTGEELILFPAMQDLGGRPMPRPIAAMRADHDEHMAALERLAALTGGFRAPDDACESWARLCAGTRKLADDLREHMRLENDVLFPRFEDREAPFAS